MQAYLILLSMALFMACPKNSIKADPLSTKSHKAATQTPLESFKITIMTGGGFSGQYSGCTFNSDGSARTWQSIGLKQDTTLVQGTGLRNQIMDLKKNLEQGVLSLGVYREVGNMTTVVKLESIDTVKAWSWPGSGVNEKTPESLKNWYTSALALCRDLEARPHPIEGK